MRVKYAVKRVVALALAIAVGLASEARAGGPDLPIPTYDNTLYVFLHDAPIGTDSDYVASRDALRAKVAPGPYARIGFAAYLAVDMPWTADPSSPVLSSPSRNWLEAAFTRLQGDGLVFHGAALLGMSRAMSVYEDARREDRRNAQWYVDNLIAAPGTGAKALVRQSWTTPSRYARKLRRHMEAKVRAFSRLIAALQTQFPDTLISASGDAEAELSDLRSDPSAPLDSQVIADYSPFAILEFRDWLLHAGLYADGGPFAGQGFKKKRSQKFVQGADALSPDNLAGFNAAFGTAFTSWSLEFYDWSLDDPIDGDPGAIPFAKYKKKSWNPLPTTGAKLVVDGFDAPRAKNDPSKKWWKVWLQFREEMIAHFARDVAEWMVTQTSPDETVFPASRWYTHQIPGDYLFGNFPGGPHPAVRLRTSASPMRTSLIPPELGSPGLTMLDRFESAGFGPSGGYNRTTQYLLPDLAAMRLANWGIPEFSPSWNIDVGPDADLARIDATWHRAYDAGAHFFGFTPWAHFTDTPNGPALGQFISEVRDAPRVPFYVPARDVFVRQTYLDLLRRAATDGEVAAGVAAIDDGSVPRGELIESLVGSSEAQRGIALLTRYYLALLGGTPDLGGLTSWLSYLNSGGCTPTSCDLPTRQGIAQAMSGTDAFVARFPNTQPVAFVSDAFQKILGRSPSQKELDTWTGALAGGGSRGDIARQFAESAEYVQRSDRDVFVILAYLGLFGRMPSDEERSEWVGRLLAGMAKQGLGQGFITSPEYLARFPS